MAPRVVPGCSLLLRPSSGFSNTFWCGLSFVLGFFLLPDAVPVATEFAKLLEVSWRRIGKE